MPSTAIHNNQVQPIYESEYQPLPSPPPQKKKNLDRWLVHCWLGSPQQLETVLEITVVH